MSLHDSTLPPAIEVSKFDINKFSVFLSTKSIQKQDSANKVKMPYYAFPLYKYSIKNGDDTEEISAPLLCITGDIKLTAYGIPTNPKQGAPIFQTEKERAFIKIPLDLEQAACRDLNKMARDLDAYLTLPANKESHFFGGFAKKKSTDFMCYPVAKDPGTKGPQFGSMKAKFDVDYDTGNIMTRVYVRKPNGTNELQSTPTLADVEKYVKWGCTIKCALLVQKMWILKAKQLGGTPYGLTIKCIQIIVKDSGSSTRMFKDAYRQFLFSEEGAFKDTNIQAPQADCPSKSRMNMSSSDKDLSDDSEEKPKQKSARKVRVQSDENDGDDCLF